MPKIQSEILIEGSSRSLYKFTQDYNIRLNWDPFLREARLLDGATVVRIGVRAWCVAKSGIGMETEYVFLREPNIVAIKMTKGPYFLKNFAGSWRFIEISKCTTKVIFRYYFFSRYKFLEPVLKYILNKEMQKRLKNLKRKFEMN
jgi:ribosome-associated toxin RatA of RatAB toxin-antitoxin module